MAQELQGRRYAILATDGVEQIELTQPRDALHSAGARTELVSPKKDSIQGYHHLEKGDTFPVDRPLAEAKAEDYDGLVLPGGVANPDALRMNEQAVQFVRRLASAGKPIAVICHGPWTLVEAGVVRDRTLTSWPSLQTDIRNAGGRWVDREVQVDDNFVSSRKPDDLPAFCATMIEVFAQGGQGGNMEKPGVKESERSGDGQRDLEGTDYSEEMVDEAIEESFPASDPPSYTPERT